MTTMVAVLLAVFLAAGAPESKPSLALFYRPAQISSDGSRAVWSVWSVPDRYDIWLAEPGAPPRLLVSMPIEPTLSTPFLSWERAQHLTFRVRSHGGNRTVWETWRIGLDGYGELIERTETRPETAKA